MKKLIIISLILFFGGVGFSQNNKKKELQHIFMEEIQPSFPGGDAKLFSYIKLVKCYPDSAKSRGIEGKVFVQFVVKKTGELAEIKILRSPDTLLSQESIRIVKSMPKWTPGKNFNGDSVDVRMVLPINFKINQEEVFKYVEQQPSFPGGDTKLFEFLGKSIKYPELEMQNRIRSKFYFEFIVEKDGSLSNLKLLKNESQELYKSAALVFNEMPKWNPGLQNGKPVRTRMVIPLNITFR